MYWRSASNPVSGDRDAVGDAEGGGVAWLLAVLGEPLHAERKASNAIHPIPKTILFIARYLKRVVNHRSNLLIADIQNRALLILVNNIKPTARPRMVKKVVMIII